eukprot:TRINITY_DN3330_c0_g1_i5.p1 TRINITY_DN3330_c0_g1~~TRINITY_DN3330_c0_g1_i5.p1  ORF type:complete len:264 (-),score=42.74 TRINITY_DN3330_c0_g1_i5:102-797(-)
MAFGATRSKASLLSACLLLALFSVASLTFTSMWRGSVPRVAPRSVRASSRITRAAGDGFIPLDAVEPAVSAYVSIWTPLFKSAKESGLAPDFLLHWGHGAAMGTVLLAMGGYGTYLGWQTRFGNGGETSVLTLGKTYAEMHSTLMGAALFFFFLGGQGGLVLLATQGQPILQSAHSSTAVVGLGLMAVQAALGLTMGPSPEKRTAHAVLGTSVMLVLLVHLFYGVSLGNSF